MNDTLLIVPTYNNAGTLEEVLVRCQRQGLPLLVVDDGSTDGTREILSGVTLESLVVAGRVARAIRKKAEAGTLSLSDFPLLVHADRVVTEGVDASLPWEAFTFETL